MLGELDELLSSTDFESDGAIHLARLTRSADGVLLLLDMRSYNGDFERQAWTVACDLLLAMKIGAETWQGLELCSDHVLLAPHTSPQAQLAMKGPAADPRRAIADLWTRHQAIAQGWIPFDAYFNPSLPLSDLLASTSGFLAEGPRQFLDQYADTLAPHGVDAYITREYPTQRWENGEWHVAPSNAQALVLSPDDYIIGVGFSARRSNVEELAPVA